jgi:hypothetical protein
MADEFFIADLRPDWRRDPYVSFWRPNNAGYAYPLPWSGRYSKATVDERPRYYAYAWARRYHRFPVPCFVVERLATDKPAAHVIDGDVGPVVPNTDAIRAALRRSRYIPEGAQLMPQHVEARG